MKKNLIIIIIFCFFLIPIVHFFKKKYFIYFYLSYCFSFLFFILFIEIKNIKKNFIKIIFLFLLFLFTSITIIYSYILIKGHSFYFIKSKKFILDILNDLSIYFVFFIILYFIINFLIKINSIFLKKKKYLLYILNNFLLFIFIFPGINIYFIRNYSKISFENIIFNYMFLYFSILFYLKYNKYFFHGSFEFIKKVNRKYLINLKNNMNIMFEIILLLLLTSIIYYFIKIKNNKNYFNYLIILSNKKYLYIFIINVFNIFYYSFSEELFFRYTLYKLITFYCNKKKYIFLISKKYL